MLSRERLFLAVGVALALLMAALFGAGLVDIARRAKPAAPAASAPGDAICLNACRCRTNPSPVNSPAACPSCSYHFYSAQPPGSYVRCPRCQRIAYVENAGTGGTVAGDLPASDKGSPAGNLRPSRVKPLE